MDKEFYDKLDPVHKAFFDQELNKSPKMGTGYIAGKWKFIIAMLVLILPYLLLLIDSLLVQKILFTYSLFLSIYYVIVVKANKELIFNINPFDYVWFQFTNFIGFVINISFTYYTLFFIQPDSFRGLISNQTTFIDFIYYSMVTITTLGYGDIVPNSLLTKILVIYELGFGLWFLVTVIPVAISIQSERLFQLNRDKSKYMEEISKGMKEGRWETVFKGKGSDFKEQMSNQENKDINKKE